MTTQEFTWLISGMLIGSWLTIWIVTASNDDSKVNGYYRDDERF